MKPEYIWICGPEEYKTSSVSKYSLTYIDYLRKAGYSIRSVFFSHSAQSWQRFVVQFFIVPLKVLTIWRGKEKIFQDEGYALLLNLPFFPFSSSTFIVHDYRDPHLTNASPSWKHKIYYTLILRGLKKLKKTKHIISVSKFTSHTLQRELQIPKKNITIIYNTFCADQFFPLPTELKPQVLQDLSTKYQLPPLSKNIILFVGSEEDRKNLISLLKSLKNLSDTTLLKVGRPVVSQNRYTHTQYAQKHDIPCHFIDFVEEEDLAKFYQIADICVLPSLFEGFGRPPIESQMCGCPVVTTHSGGLQEAVSDSALILQDPLNPSEITTKISQLLNSPQLSQKYISRGILNSQKFLISSNGKKWESLLNA